MPDPITGLVGASLGGTVAQTVSASKAAKAGERAADKADDTQRYIFDEQVRLTEPQREVGNNALAALAFEAGIGPQPTTKNALRIDEITDSPVYQREPIRAMGGKGEGAILGYENVLLEGGGPRFGVGDRLFDTRDEAQSYIDSVPGQFDYDPIDMPDPNLDLSNEAFEASPGYNWRLQQGQQAIERSAAARGMRNSGNVLKDLLRFGQGTASDERARWVGETTDQFNRSYGVGMDKMNALRGLAGQGQQATNAQIQAGNVYASGVSNNAFARGNAQAHGAWRTGNALAGLANSSGDILGLGMSGYLGKNPGFGIKPLTDPFAAPTVKLIGG